MAKPTILTGLRANNELHIGNYFGALKPIVDMAKSKSDQYMVNLFVPDLHSFTTPIDHSELQNQIMNNLRHFVAAGLPLDASGINIYRQSYIPAHSELTWILDCYTGFGEMSRMTQFKDKSEELSRDRVSVGLFNYPVLMASDILLYNASYIPVGGDQTQHLEFTRTIAERFNSRFGDNLFTVPETVEKQREFFGLDQPLRLKSLSEPTKKMSKSSESSRGIIFLTDAPEEAAKKIMSAATDDFGEIKYDPKERPGISSLIDILALLKGNSSESTAQQYNGQKSYSDFKAEVSAEMTRFLAKYQENMALVDDRQLIKKLESSEKEVTKIAETTLLRAQKAVGLR